MKGILRKKAKNYFGHKLDYIETDLLLAFSTSGILVLPDVDFTSVEVNKGISRLVKKKYIKGSRPWVLTKLGFKIKKDLTENSK
jgi:hypothetical protein